MRSPLTAIALVAGAAFAAPAGALAQAPVWTDAGAGVPPNVNLSAVAVYQGSAGEVVVAVGRDTSGGQAVVYRYAAGAWQQDAIQDLSADTCLTAVAIDQQAAWAVGSQGGGCPGDPNGSGKALLVRSAGGGDALAMQAGQATWTAVSPASGSPTPGPASAISLNGTSGYLAAGAQGAYSFTDGAAPSFTPVSFTPAPSAIDGVALYGAQSGYAAGAGPNGADAFDISSSPVGDTSAPFAPPAPQSPLVGVAALSAANAIAIEGPGTNTPGWWSPDANGVWERHGDAALNSATLSAVSIGQSSATAPVAEAIAGADSLGQGTVWQRTLDQSSFTERTVACAPLRGVAVAGSSDVWAVGDAGTLLHYTPSGGTAAGCAPPPPPVTSTQPSSPSDSPAPSPSSSTSSSSSSPSSTSSSQGSSNGVEVSVVQPSSPPPPRTTKPTRRPTRPTRRKPLLVRDVRVSVERGRLLVACKLTAPARMSAIAMRSGRVVGRSAWRTFHGRTCRLAVPYTGSRPPAQLQIVALPLARGRTRTQAP
jgi:hypothetical protein